MTYFTGEALVLGEIVDLAFNAWSHDQFRTTPNVAGSVRLAPVWTRGHERRPRVRKKPV